MRSSFHQLETIAIRKCIGKLVLMRNKNDAFQLFPKSVKLLNHIISPCFIQATKSLINNHRFDTASLTTCIATDSQRQAYSYTETLTATHQTYRNGMLSRIMIIYHQV